jgi:type I restriction enzyme S subunit
VSEAVITHGWVTKPLIEVATLQRGYDLPTQDRTHGPYPIFAANGPVGTHGSAKCKGPGVVTGRSGTIGKVHFVDGDYWPLNTSLFVTDFHGNDPRWVYYLLESFGLERFSQGAGVPTLNRNLVHGEPIRVPPLPEQRRIAAILDKADALRAKRREALAQLDELTQSIFIEMFGNIQTIHNNWPVKPLGEMLDFLTSGSRGWAQHYTDSGDLFLRIQNVRHDELDLSDVAYVSAPDSAEAKRTKVHEGDVLLSITADLGRSAVVPKDIGKAHINQHLSILRTKSLVPRYLSAFIASPAGQIEVMGRNKQGVKAGLNFDDIKSFRIPVPPRHLQRDFAMRVEKVGKQIRIHGHSVTELDSLFTSLQHRAFRGEL